MRLLGLWPGGRVGVVLSVVIGGALIAVGVAKRSPVALVIGAFVLLRGGAEALRGGSGGQGRGRG